MQRFMSALSKQRHRRRPMRMRLVIELEGGRFDCRKASATKFISANNLRHLEALARQLQQRTVSGEDQGSSPPTAVSGEDLGSNPPTAVSGEDLGSNPPTAVSGEDLGSTPPTAVSGEDLGSSPPTAVSGEDLGSTPSYCFREKWVQVHLLLSIERTKVQAYLMYKGDEQEPERSTSLGLWLRTSTNCIFRDAYLSRKQTSENMKTSFVVFALVMLLVAISGAQASDYRCTRNGGTCRNRNTESCWTGSWHKYLCVGPSNRQCCIPWIRW
ncbi:hypothetical protein LSAT2_013882 [Lamellibrachia satsuma]|nr:hypothetical protein LSAT2_013882 [Lamellibrachia satsuma]